MVRFDNGIMSKKQKNGFPRLPNETRFLFIVRYRSRVSVVPIDEMEAGSIRIMRCAAGEQG